MTTKQKIEQLEAKIAELQFKVAILEARTLVVASTPFTPFVAPTSQPMIPLHPPLYGDGPGYYPLIVTSGEAMKSAETIKTWAETETAR